MRLCLLVKVLGESGFPHLNPSLEAELDRLRLKVESTDLVVVQDLVDLFFERNKLLELSLKVFKLRIL